MAAPVRDGVDQPKLRRPSVAASSAAIEADGLAKHYGGLVAVADLSFVAERGEILGVLGPNGAGKTTAIRVLTTILAPSGGEFAVAGVRHTRPVEIRRRIGVLPENAGYPEQQTGEEYLRYHARLYGHGRGSARRVAETLLTEVGLADRRSSLIASYSRGMRQRLGLARALVNEPQVVFLDEPTLGLDPAGQRQVLALVRRIARERGATVLLSSHLLAEVEEICSAVLILNRGRVVASGTVSEVARRAAAPRTATVRVPPDQVARVGETLADMKSIASVGPVDDRLGSVVVTLSGDGGAEAMNAGLRALADAGVPIVGFELEGARLSDAFLTMTETTT